MISRNKLCFFAMVVITILTTHAPAQDEKMPSLNDLVPMEAEGWKASEKGNLYDKLGIFHYMDGAGEVYLSYAYRELFVRELAKEGEEPITIELFDMGNSYDAFGVFTRGRIGGKAGIGQGSAYDTGYLLFWKDRYFASIYTFKENEASKKAILEIGAAIAGNIHKKGPLPNMVGLLPEKNLVKDSVRYFHKHTCLNHHYFLSDENFLDLDSETEATLADYKHGDDSALLLTIRYPDDKRALAAYGRFIDIYLPEGRFSGLARLENNKWTGAGVEGGYLLVVFDAATGELAGELLSSAKQRIGESGQ